MVLIPFGRHSVDIEEYHPMTAVSAASRRGEGGRRKALGGEHLDVDPAHRRSRGISDSASLLHYFIAHIWDEKDET
jgi:hypothetical protein